MPRPESLASSASTEARAGDARADTPIAVSWGGKGCALGRDAELAARLGALTTPDDPLMSLELWGDRDDFAAGQSVLFNIRAARRGYATLFWIGPDDDVFVVFAGVRVPGARDVSIDAGAMIVPPLGNERWVAILALEDAPFPCQASRDALGRWLHTVRGRAHAVGHWAVRSGDAPRRKK